MSVPTRLLFVCTANVCRSPFMEVYARSVLGTEVIVSSAGTHGLDAQPMSDAMATELEARGLARRGFLSRRLTAAILDESDLVLTAEDRHRQFVIATHPQAADKVLTLGRAVGSDQGVADPYGRGPAAAATAAAHMAAMLDSLLPDLALTTSPEEAPIHG